MALSETDRIEQQQWLSIILGGRLTSVQFVLNYLILGFDEKGALTSMIWPELRASEGVSSFGMDDYRNRLCALIGSVVSRVDMEGDETISIKFERGAELRISLSFGSPGSERAILTGPNHLLAVF